MQFIFLFFSFTLHTLWLSFPSLHLLFLTPFISSSFCSSSYPTPPLLSLGHAHGSNRSSSRSPGGVEQSTRSTLLSGFQSTTCEPMFVWSERSIYCMLSGIEPISNAMMRKTCELCKYMYVGKWVSLTSTVQSRWVSEGSFPLHPPNTPLWTQSQRA